jgi:hypothetical protein
MAGAFVNGEYYAYGDIELTLVPNTGGPAGLYIGLKEINYSDELGRSYVRGAARLPLGTTSGRYEAKCEVFMYLPAWLTFLNTVLIPLGPIYGGWKRIPFTISASYTAVAGLPVNTDTITNATIKMVDAAQSESEEALGRKITFFPQGVLWGGVVASILEPQKAFAIG